MLRPFASIRRYKLKLAKIRSRVTPLLFVGRLPWMLIPGPVQTVSSIFKAGPGIRLLGTKAGDVPTQTPKI